MLRSIKIIRFLLFSVTLFMLGLIVFGFFTVPDEINSTYDNKFFSNEIYTLTHLGQSIEADDLVATEGTQQYEVEVSLFNAIPIKSSSLTVSQRQYVTVSGEIFGIRLFTDGILIVGIDSVETSSGSVTPAQDAGLQTGDIIKAVSGIEVNSCDELTGIFSSSDGNVLIVEYERDSQLYETSFSLAYSEAQGAYKAGLWIRDSAAGVGTMTFYDETTGIFAGLGHAVCDVDTGSVLQIASGDIVDAVINGCYKGTSGVAGELCGSFTSSAVGTLLINCECGVYGFTDDFGDYGIVMPVALTSEIQEGYAQIISTIDSGEPQYYDIEITNVSSNNSDKNMTIKVTDEELIEKTGGIVQGMSGSPIIQNGMIVGAVTHVFVNDPTKGYAIFIENMLDVANNLTTLEEAA